MKQEISYTRYISLNCWNILRYDHLCDILEISPTNLNNFYEISVEGYCRYIQHLYCNVTGTEIS